MQLSLTPLAIKSDFKGQAHHQNGYDSGGHKTHSFLLCVFVTNLGIGSEVVGNKYNNA